MKKTFKHGLDVEGKEYKKMVKYTRRHYIDVANILNRLQDTRTKKIIIKEFISLFESDNNRFDVSRFNSVIYNQ